MCANNSFGNWLRAQRGEQKQKVFADAVGVNERLYRRWEINEFFPEERHRADLARVLSIDVAEVNSWLRPPRFFDLRPHVLSKGFIAREKELEQLQQWLRSSETVMLVWAFGGFGKSELCRYWVKRQCETPRAKHGIEKILWWSFYSYNSDFTSFVDAMFAKVELNRKKRYSPPIERMESILERLRSEAWLIVFDGFERELNAYSDFKSVWAENEIALTRAQRRCTNPLLAEFVRRILDIDSGTRLLLTSRVVPAEFQSADDRLLASVDDLRLGDLSPGDSAALLRLNGIRGSNSALVAEMSAYGGHPLALRVLCAAIASDPMQPYVARLSSRRSLIRGVVQRTEHVLARAFKNLSRAARSTITTIACFRTPVGMGQIRFLLSKSNDEAISSAVRELVALGLLTEVESERYALHPLVAGYAYRQSHRTRELHRKIAGEYAKAAVRPLEQVDTLEDLFSPIEQMFHLTQARQFEQAFALFDKRIARPLYFHVAAPHKRLELVRLFFPKGESRPPALKTPADKGQAIEYLANSYAGAGECSAAYKAYKRQIVLYRRHKLKRLGTALGAIATVACIPLGLLTEAHAFLLERVSLKESEDDIATANYQLCLFLSVLGQFAKAHAHADVALQVKLKASRRRPQAHQAVAIVYLYKAISFLLEGKARDAHRIALKATDHLKAFSQVRPLLPRDKLQLEWICSEALIRQGDGGRLADHQRLKLQLLENIRLSRTLGLAQFEADFLLTLARFYLTSRRYKQASETAQDAYQFSKDMKYVLKMSDAQLLLALAQRALGNVAASKQAANRAMSLAWSESKPYWYDPAVRVARALLTDLA